MIEVMAVHTKRKQTKDKIQNILPELHIRVDLIVQDQIVQDELINQII